jgi:hypothetical protein
MDVPHVADGQRLDLRGVALRDMFEAVAEADDLKALIDAFNRGRRDDAVESGCRPAADQNSESAFAHVKILWLLFEKRERRRMRELGKKFNFILAAINSHLWK